MSRRATPDAVLLADLRRVYAEVGLISWPIYVRFGRYSAPNIARRFGFWRQACRAAGLPVARGGNPTVRGTAEQAAEPTIARWSEERITVWNALAEQTQIRAKLRKGRVQRACLRCEQPFLSAGPHNRLCQRCAALAVATSGNWMRGTAC